MIIKVLLFPLLFVVVCGCIIAPFMIPFCLGIQLDDILQRKLKNRNHEAWYWITTTFQWYLCIVLGLLIGYGSVFIGNLIFN